jgi:Transmembrane adaptor Erv26
MFLFLLKTLASIVFLAGGSILFVVGLYRAIHFIENHPTRAKRRIEYMIWILSLTHIFLYLRGFSLPCMVYSLVCQYTFYSMLPDYPNIDSSSPSFLLAVLMVFVNHFWYLVNMIRKQMGVVEIVVYFFVPVWATPFSFFLSLTANDDVIAGMYEKKKRVRTFAGKIIDKLLGESSAKKE